YRGVVSEQNNGLFSLGAQDQWFTFNMFDAQAWFVRDIILGTIELPDAEQQRAHIDKWLEDFRQLETGEDEIYFQARYVRDLIEQTDSPMCDLKAVAASYVYSEADKNDHILHYRVRVYRSVMSGTMATVHHTPWLRELDDSLERYLSEPERVEIENMLAPEGSQTATR